MKIAKLDRGAIGVTIFLIVLFSIGYFFEPFEGHLISIAGFIAFLITIDILSERFSVTPAAGMTCVTLTDLDPEGKIAFGTEEVDARAEDGCSIKSGQQCVIANFKKSLFTKGFYVVRLAEEK